MKRICYRPLSSLETGKNFVLALARVYLSGMPFPKDFCVRTAVMRDGLESVEFSVDTFKKKRSDRDFSWTAELAPDGRIALKAARAALYLNLEANRAYLSRKKQFLFAERHENLFRFYALDKNGERIYLRLATRDEAPNRLVFTSGTMTKDSSFAVLVRNDFVYDEKQKPRLTVGTVADIHIDYGIQLFKPYVRDTLVQTADGYRKRFDLDAMILCGDSFSDNGSYGYLHGGAYQGRWGYDRFLLTKQRFDRVIRSSFRDPSKAHRVFHLTGNHEYQLGDRQPEGMSYNSANFCDLLPNDILDPLYETMNVDLGPKENLLCYRYEVNGYDFLVLNTPAYPVFAHMPGHRGSQGHDLRQAEWLEARLDEIRSKKGKNAVVFVSTHYPFFTGSYIPSGASEGHMEAFQRIYEKLMSFPNLFYFYGHTHGGDYLPIRTRTGQSTHSLVRNEVQINGTGASATPILPDGFERGHFSADLVRSDGFTSCYGGSLSYYKNHFVKSDGKKVDTWLTHEHIPFCQACVTEVYDDYVVLTMQNFGKRSELSSLPDSSYRIEPVVIPLVKDEK